MDKSVIITPVECDGDKPRKWMASFKIDDVTIKSKPFCSPTRAIQDLHAKVKEYKASKKGNV